MKTEKWVVVQTCIILSVVYQRPCHPVVDNRMTKADQCPGQVISWPHRFRTFAARSTLECVVHCETSVQCQSIVFDLDNRLCHLGNATSEASCSNMETAVGRLKYYELACQNGGQMDSQGNCVCIGNNVGPRCERIMEDCTEGVMLGTVVDKGVYNIKPALSPAPFPVYCRVLAELTRTQVMHRETASFSFNRSWEEYRDGFGDVNGDFWLGLEKLHQLTNSKTYGLRFLIKPPDFNVTYSFYDGFVLGNETSGYSFSVERYRSNQVEDCLTDLQGVPFSAYDVDRNENSSVNCALQHGGGWWFKGENCTVCNPTGPVLPPFDGLRKNTLGEMFWVGIDDLYPFPVTMYLVV